MKWQMKQKNEITSIADLVKILTTLGETEQEHTRFFRGQADSSWKMLPSIYRNPNLIKNEHKIIKEALTNCPNDFLPTDTLFEKLVKLQHYNYPTRLLDLTANALVALYFACWNTAHHEKDGELIILDIPDKSVKYGDSDTVAILSALSLRDERFDLCELYKYVNNDMIIKVYENKSRLSLFSKDSKENLKTMFNVVDTIEGDFETWVKEAEERQRQILFREIINSEPQLALLLHDIRADKPSFAPVIETADLNKVLCVKAKLNNARISRQQGSFLIFGIDENKLQPANVPDDWKKYINGKKIIIKAQAKAKIMKELKSFGISKQTLFPELESQAEEIIKQYEK